MHVHNACYVLMDIVLLVHPTQASTPHALLLGGLLLLAGATTLALGIHRRRTKQGDNDWFILSSTRDILFGVTLLIQAGQPLATLVNILGLWGIMYAFSQAIEAIFYFLGTRNDQKEDYGIELIHAACVLIAGGFAFTLIMRPEGLPASLGFVGLFLILLGLAQGLLTRRLRGVLR